MKRLNKEKLAVTIEKRAVWDLEQCNIGGASALVYQAGETVYYNSFNSDKAPEINVNENTLFRLASMTKPITAVAAMILVERGLLSLEDTVDRFYPAFSSLQVRNEDGSLVSTDVKITVKNILTHSSGIASGAAWIESVKRLTPKNIESVEAFIEFLSKEPLSFIPGTKQEYSGIGAFSVLTGIIQKITKMTYEDFLKREIFDKCRMVDTTFVPSDGQWDRIVPMHNKVDGENRIAKTCVGCVYENVPAHNYLGGAGLISSVKDYFNFAQMLMNGGEFEGNRIISETSVAEISKPQFFKRSQEWWGLGVRVIMMEREDSLPIGTYGWSGAYGSHFWIDTTNRIIGIYMKNSRYDGGSGAVTSKNFESDVYSSFDIE